MKDKTSHGHGAKIAYIIEDFYLIIAGGAKAVQQRQVVVRCWYGIGCVRQVFVVDDCLMIMADNGIADCIVEAVCHWCAAFIVPFHPHQIVDNIAAAKDQITLLS